MLLFSRLLVVVIGWGVLSFGAVYPWAYWPMAVAASWLGAGAIAVTEAWRDARARTIAWAWAAIAAAIALQLVPLPHDVFAWLSPGGEELLRQTRLGFATNPPAWLTLSIAPGSTVTSLLLFLAFGILLVGLMRAVSYMPLDLLVGRLMALGLALALFGIIQQAIGAPNDPRVYGFWKPHGIGTPFGPFINRNHFAGWMLMLLPLVAGHAIGVMRMSRTPDRRDLGTWLRWLLTPDASRFAFVSSAMLVMGIALVLTGSRSGIASVILAMTVLAYFVARQVQGHTRRALAVGYIMLLVVGVFGWTGLEATVDRFERAPSEIGERVTAWRDTTRIIRDFPLFGTGFGGYGAAMLVYQTADRTSIYAQAHNDYLQVLAEGGLVIAVPVMAALVVLIGAVRRRLLNDDDETSVRWIRAGAVAGLVGIAAQSFLDFSLQMPGNAILFILLLAIAIHRPAPSTYAHRV